MGTLSLHDYQDVNISAPWGNIAGRWYGNRDERPILAIHGWLDNLGTFDTLIPLLPDYLGVLCIDLPGHGRSAPLPPGVRYSVNDYVFIIARVVKEYKWTRVSLMGHSLGGLLSYIYTALCPHAVDMVISLDIIHPYVQVPSTVDIFMPMIEKNLIEDERAEQGRLHEPPSYTPAQLLELFSNVLPAEYAQHLIYRNVAKSQLYPDKFYFSRDGRVKFYTMFPSTTGLAVEMARRIKHTPYLIIKASESIHIASYTNEALSILSTQNAHFEYYEVQGGHHVHLTNAADCAKYIVPFVRRHRPPTLASWSLADEKEEAGSVSKQQRRIAQERFFVWRRQKPQQQRNKL